MYFPFGGVSLFDFFFVMIWVFAAVAGGSWNALFHETYDRNSRNYALIGLTGGILGILFFLYLMRGYIDLLRGH